MSIRGHPLSRCRGVGLVELMVSIVFSLLLLAGMLQMYISNQQGYRLTQASSRIQENGRFAIDLMAYDLRMAGVFWACPEPPARVYNHLNPSAGYVDFGTDAISGTDNSGLNGSDTVTLRSAVDDPILVTSPSMPTAAAALHVQSHNGLAQGDTVVVTDCVSADRFQITNTDPDTTGTVAHDTGAAASPGNAASSLTTTYAPGSFLFRSRRSTYSVQGTASGEPALFRNGTAMVEDIENLQVGFGIDNDQDGTVDSYLDPGLVSDWSRVVNVRIGLVARSRKDFITDHPQSYAYWGGNVTAGDRRLHRVFTKIVTLRNRVP